MQMLLRHKLLIAGVIAVMAASAGAAYAATQSGTNPQQAFINDVAKRLNVSPTQLSAAVRAALIDRIDAAVKDGKITQAQANKLEQRLDKGGRLPFFFGGPGGGLGLGLGRGFGARHGFFGRPFGGGSLQAAASYLGVSNSQLMSDLASGKSLAQVAQAHGKSVSGLEQALISAETKSLAQLESHGTITKAQEQKILGRLSTRIDKLVNGKGVGFGRFGKGPRFAMPGGPPKQGGPMQGGPMMPPGGSSGSARGASGPPMAPPASGPGGSSPTPAA